MTNRLELPTLIIALVLTLVPAQAEDATAQQGLKAVVVQAEIPKGGDFMGFGFDSLWMMYGTRLIRVDAADNSFIEIEIEGISGGRTRGVGIGQGAVWIPDPGSGTVYKIDPGSNRVVGKIPAQMLGSEGSIGVGEGSVWVVTWERNGRTLSRFNAESGAPEARILLPSSGAGVVVDYGWVWVTGDVAGELYRIDPKTNEIDPIVSLRRSPRFLASGEGSIWVLNQGDGSVQRIDGVTGKLTATIEAGVAGGGGDIATGGGYVWVTTLAIPLVQIDPRTNAVVGKLGDARMGDAIRYGAGSIWISGPSIFRIQPPD